MMGMWYSHLSPIQEEECDRKRRGIDQPHEEESLSEVGIEVRVTVTITTRVGA